jgi:hypothetical protein
VPGIEGGPHQTTVQLQESIIIPGLSISGIDYYTGINNELMGVCSGARSKTSATELEAACSPVGNSSVVAKHEVNLFVGFRSVARTINLITTEPKAGCINVDHTRIESKARLSYLNGHHNKVVVSQKKWPLLAMIRNRIKTNFLNQN